MATTLYRRSDNKMLAGVCSGIADYLHTDVNLVRLIWVVVTLCTGFWFGILAYAIAWAMLPEQGTGRHGYDDLKDTYDAKVKPTVDEKIKPMYDEKVKPTVDEKVKPFYDEKVKPTVDKAMNRDGASSEAAAPSPHDPLDVHPEDTASTEPHSVWEQPYEPGTKHNPFDDTTNPAV